MSLAPPPSSNSYPREVPSSSTSISSHRTPSAKNPQPTTENLDRDADVLIQNYIFNAPSDIRPPSSGELPLPLCIPQITVNANEGSAFARGYNPALAEVGISQEMLLDFIDGMNLAIVNSPPLRIVGVAGQLLEFVYVIFSLFSEFTQF